MSEQNKLVLFQEKGIRKTWHNEEWWFAIVDVIEVLTENKRPRRYWNDLKKKLVEEGLVQLSDLIGQLKIEAADGKKYKTDCANTEGIFRIIQSVPSPKAEPFKQWLATVGYERVQEIENPELAAERARQYYQDLGYSEEWIDARMKSIDVRGKLTDEWQNRGVKKGLEYAILTAEISRATFGLAPSEYKNVKGLKRENLRDHMTDLELIFTMLGETTTRNRAIDKNAKGFIENRNAAVEGGTAAGKALDAYEDETGVKVVSEENFLKQISDAKKQKKLNKGKDNQSEE